MSKIERDEISGTDTTGHEWDGIKELNTPLPRWWVLTDAVARSASGKPDYRWARDAVLATLEPDQES